MKGEMLETVLLYYTSLKALYSMRCFYSHEDWRKR
jgi:hypothetical protein